MKPITRRRWTTLAAGAISACHWSATRLFAAPRKMKIALTPGSIQVKASQEEVIEFAKQYGFEAAEPFGAHLATLSATQLGELSAKVKAYGLHWAAAGLPVEFRRTDAAFQSDFEKLPAISKALQRAGVTRVGTYIMPTSDELTYTANLKQHAARLGQVAQVLADNGQRLGLEYVGPKTLWTLRKYPFVHCMAEMKDLIAAINKPNVGFVLDSWHWYTAGETAKDLETLTNQDIISCDLNDAPVNLPIDQQIDSKRELPMVSGVIDLKSFLNTLHRIGYDGPVRAEPFNSTLRAMTREQALAVVAASMKRAFSLIEE